MENSSSDLENEIETLLKTLLKNEHLKNISVNISGNSEKGDGYLGDIVFVAVSGTSSNKSRKTLDFVLKRSKNSIILRETSPVKEAFLNEIFVYEVIFPYFIQFQRQKGVEDPFNNIPRCYGSLAEEDREIIVLENLNSIGYELWPKKDPLSRTHVELVVKEYGKLHATSVALHLQRPNVVQQFAGSLENMMDKFKETSDLSVLFGDPIDLSYELLKHDLDENILARWLDFKKQIDYICGDMCKNTTGIKAILHGDCWNNNFMFLHDENKVPRRVVFLDWQIARYFSPILDLSHFLFSSVTPEDLNELDDITNVYYQSFIHQLGQLDVENPETVYPLTQFLQEWKSYCRYGVLLASLVMKVVSIEKDEVNDLVRLAEDGKKFSDTFTVEIKDKENFKRRMRPLIEYAVKNDLI